MTRGPRVGVQSSARSAAGTPARTLVRHPVGRKSGPASTKLPAASVRMTGGTGPHSVVGHPAHQVTGQIRGGQGRTTIPTSKAGGSVLSSRGVSGTSSSMSGTTTATTTLSSRGSSGFRSGHHGCHLHGWGQQRHHLCSWKHLRGVLASKSRLVAVFSSRTRQSSSRLGATCCLGFTRCRGVGCYRSSLGHPSFRLSQLHWSLPPTHP